VLVAAVVLELPLVEAALKRRLSLAGAVPALVLVDAAVLALPPVEAGVERLLLLVPAGLATSRHVIS
jgi:hypothetical protein